MLKWPELEKRFPHAYNEWYQSTNFLTTKGKPQDYEPIHLFSVDKGWEGISPIIVNATFKYVYQR